MNICFSGISLNARGLRDNIKRKSIFLFCKGEKANFILLQETHSKPEDEKFWVNQWGDKIIFDHGSTKSAGLAILFCNSPGNEMGKNAIRRKTEIGILGVLEETQ